MTNVVRFPVERQARPTLDLLRDIAPDMREVLLIAETFDLDTQVADLQARVDRETTEYILNAYPADVLRRPGLLDELLAPLVTRAISACRTAHEVSAAAAEAQQPCWRRRLPAALGAARAVGMAQRGEPWIPRDDEGEDDALLNMGRFAG